MFNASRLLMKTNSSYKISKRIAVILVIIFAGVFFIPAPVWPEHLPDIFVGPDAVNGGHAGGTYYRSMSCNIFEVGDYYLPGPSGGLYAECFPIFA